jgi:hypothetical protein
MIPQNRLSKTEPNKVEANRFLGPTGYPHEKRNALRIPKVREILNEHIEDWDQVIRALN